MIIVKLKGGLGNQMFQYALGRRLSLRYRVPLELDLSHLRPDFFNFLGMTTFRKYALGDFNIRAKFASCRDLPFLSKIPSTRLTAGLNKLLNPQGQQTIRELSCSYSKNIESILGAGNSVYLDGFWNNEMYFKEIVSVIRRDFSLKRKLSAPAIKLARQIFQTNSVSIHFRRKDYVTNLNTRRFHGTCNLDYYYKAISFINGRVKNPHFYIFSDDPDWVKKNLKLKESLTYVSGSSGLTNAEELILMSKCEHNIIPNSSFSWWGAWLNKNPSKIVVVPEMWFRARVSDSDIAPRQWIRV
jgi:Glycosyl transferase family 11